jgi:SAM-dependent methyltransferase
MSATSVSVLLPLTGTRGELAPILDTLGRYLESTGFDFEILPLRPHGGERPGALLRRAIGEARGSVIAVVDPELPYPVSAIGDAVALIESGASEVVFATSRRENSDDPRHTLLRWFLVPILPDPAIQLKAFSRAAARLVVGETRRSGEGFDLEIAFLANKYGFRVERLHVEPAGSSTRKPSFGGVSGLLPAFAIRMTNRRMGYRASRRCRVCFSSDVWSSAQIPGNVVRECRRCKCRYLAHFPEEGEEHPVRRVLRGQAIAAPPREETRSATAREKTAQRRLAVIRKQVTPGARLLEIGVRDGTFGLAGAREFEYVGIDHAQAAVRAARARGLEVYCATLSSFVNTGPAFDAIALFHVFENMSDPHDALARMKDLLKPGGVLFLTTFDTEGLVYLLSERRRMAYNFRTHRILYSRSALIELLEHSGFEIEAIGPGFEYRDHWFLRHWLAARWPRLAPVVNALLRLLPDPLLVSPGSIRIVAKRRAGTPVNVHAIRSVEPTHAR